MKRFSVLLFYGFNSYEEVCNTDDEAEAHQIYDYWAEQLLPWERVRIVQNVAEAMPEG
jgi:hypothetical protein